MFFFIAKAQITSGPPRLGNACMTKDYPYRIYFVYMGTNKNKPAYRGYYTGFSDWTAQNGISDYPNYKWTQTAVDGCYIRLNPNGNYTIGNYGNVSFAPKSLPIDDYTLLFAILIAGISAVYIYQNAASSTPKT